MLAGLESISFVPQTTSSEYFVHVPKKRFKDELYYEHHSEYAGPKWYDKYIPDWLPVW